MKILSLFDGISIAQQALKNIGANVETYYASEIDKYAIQITQKNFPNTIQVGSVVDLNGRVLHLSGVYDILKLYDTNIQNKLSKQEMLYWLNENFSISAKVGTQIKNGNASESTTIQCIEEIWFSKCGVGDIIKTQRLIGSRIERENGNIQAQEILLQCGEWGYVYRSNARDTEENISRVGGQETKTRKYRKNTTSGTSTMENTRITEDVVRSNKVRDEKEQTEISARIEKQEEWGSKEDENRKEKARSYVQKISFPLSSRDDNETITKREWIQLSVYPQMETTVVESGKTIEIFIGTFGLLCGGSPCQDLSIAKKDRKGLDGKRSGLFWEYVRILKQLKPKYFILENVFSMGRKERVIITRAVFDLPEEEWECIDDNVDKD